MMLRGILRFERGPLLFTHLNPCINIFDVQRLMSYSLLVIPLARRLRLLTTQVILCSIINRPPFFRSSLLSTIAILHLFLLLCL